MLDSYISSPGGSGATLGLIIIAILPRASRRADYRQKTCAAVRYLQINEPSLPARRLLYEPGDVYPFILVLQPIPAAITLVAYYLGVLFRRLPILRRGPPQNSSRGAP